MGHGSGGGSLQGLAEVQSVQAAIDQHIANIETVKVLEAGCGSLSRVNLGDHKYVVGLDIDAPMLENNQALDEKILGDVETYEFPSDSFDLMDGGTCSSTWRIPRRPWPASRTRSAPAA